MSTLWSSEKSQAYNNYAWVEKTRCSGKSRFENFSKALKMNLAKDHKHFKSRLAQNGQHRSLTAVYICPHCGHYHNGGTYKPLFTARLLVICSESIEGQLASSGSTPNSRRARGRWNSRLKATRDPNAHSLLVSSGYTSEHQPRPGMALYWIEQVILPAEEAMLWLIKQRMPQVEWFILDPTSKVAIYLNEYC